MTVDFRDKESIIPTLQKYQADNTVASTVWRYPQLFGVIRSSQLAIAGQDPFIQRGLTDNQTDFIGQTTVPFLLA